MDLRLDTLPLEILQRIIWSGRCENAVVLSQVNRTLHRVCQNPLIFKRIIEYGNGYSSNSPPLWWQLASLDGMESYRTCAKWALADSKALQIIHNRKLISPFDIPILNWWPLLAAVHHPITVLTELSSGGALFATERNWSMIQDSSFAYTCTVLARILDGDASIGNRIEGFLEVYRQQLDPRYTLPELLIRGLHDLGDHDLLAITVPSEIEQIHLHAKMALALIVRELVFSMKQGRLRRNGLNPAGESLLPPRPSNIPFAETLHFGAPFSDRSEQATRQNTVLRSINASFFEQGPWVGYYCYARQMRDVIFDTMMQNICFQAVPYRDDLLSLTATGYDLHGHFRLHGHASTKTGVLTLHKVYEHGVQWEWRSVLTPFGIVGSWGRMGWGGWFWIWKASWSLPG